MRTPFSGGAEYVTAQAVNLAVDDFSMKDVAALLESSNGCHIAG
jgi:hypothetical protein